MIEQTLLTGVKSAKVMLLQNRLSEIGYNPGPVDGIFGSLTRNAVIRFQTDRGLKPDGIVDSSVWKALVPYITGFSDYAVSPGDTIQAIAQLHYTTVSQIETCNPEMDPGALQSGLNLKVPFGIDVVPVNIHYTPDILDEHVLGLKTRYPFLETGIIGNSVLGNPLYYLRLGTGAKKVIYNGAHHALEWITSVLLLRFAENFCRAFSLGEKIRGIDIRGLYQNCSIYVVPMVNPDGVDLVVNGLSRKNPFYYDLLRWNRTGLPAEEVWKANIRGVDLNLNYPANWDRAKDLEEKFGAWDPSPCRHAGSSPLSEPETAAMARFTENIDPDLVIAYHTQGRVIYWNYGETDPPRSREIAEILAGATGYALEETAPEDSYAGYKDWFIQDFGKPGYTIEAGIGTNPLPIAQFGTIYRDNEKAMLLAALLA